MKLRILYFLTIAALLTSCEDTLTENPDSYYQRKDFFVNTSNAQLAVTGIYNVLPTIYGDKDGMAIPCSDDTYFVSGLETDNTRRGVTRYDLKPSNTWIETVWKGKYEGLNRANYTISGIEGMEDYPNSDELKKIAAEARFLRAQAAFDLARYWGDVPFKTTYSDSYEDAYLPRTDREVIYDQVIQDLNFAKEYLPWADASSSPERATQGAARALLMRVLLTRAGYALQMDGKITRPGESVRKSYFEAVIDEWEAFQKNGYHQFYTGGYDGLFKGFSAGTLNSEESLFEVAFLASINKGYWGTYIGPNVTAPDISPAEADKFMGRANGTFRAVPEWKGFFEETDVRRDIMICTYKYDWDSKLYNHKKVEQKNVRNWYPGKWRRDWMPVGYEDPNQTDVNFCMLRYADVVLMAAEAYNETGNTPEAWSLLNSVRKRAGATEITANNYTSLLKAPKVYNLNFIEDADEAGRFRTALYWERGFELAFEGQRKYDLIRWGILKEALTLFCTKVNSAINGPSGIYYAAGYNFQKGKHELLPIPEDELQINYKLENKNNPGY
ncbi:RagB/SusD family nutrient uptake outer membrane protein [Bacteroides sp.]|uniref:RagB/SusD family nutrient uptake outer membrane protein n=1 Tax=Bacteroides sp. TaxID=29523 RepID=UPI0026316378|nr:RagB/SusD family nutrient uptake outer membrane protein [Bacteroides sp.]